MLKNGKNVAYHLNYKAILFYERFLEKPRRKKLFSSGYF
ncbi:hypothetical protein NO004_530033 [Flavobacterium psychrophilum]|nr:hypothetical protein NO004_530033 [Flavobacterium psychrophilum]